jgi:hypothetical protein
MSDFWGLASVVALLVLLGVVGVICVERALRRLH